MDSNNTFHVFSEPLKAFSDVFTKLEKAKKSIYIETFELKNDSVGKELIQILIEKSKIIPVTLIVDDRGLGILPKKVKQKIKNSNIEYLIFNPWFVHIKKLRLKRLFSNMLHTNHRKLTIIDDKIAYVGGVNYSGKEINWRDIFVRIKGPLVNQLILASKEMKGIVSKKRHERRKIFSQLSRKNKKFDDKVIRQIPQIWALTKSKNKTTNKSKNKTKNTISKDIKSKNIKKISKQILSKRHHTLTTSLIREIKKAKKEILITTPYFVPPLQLLIPLHNAIKRKVKITILVPRKSDGKMSSILTRHFAFVAYKENINMFLLPKMTHAKYVIIDDKYCSFGSANLDYQTWFHNYELNIGSKNEKLIKQVKRIWNKDLKTASEFDPKKDYLNRTRMHRLYERILKKFKHRF